MKMKIIQSLMILSNRLILMVFAIIEFEGFFFKYSNFIGKFDSLGCQFQTDPHIVFAKVFFQK